MFNVLWDAMPDVDGYEVSDEPEVLALDQKRKENPYAVLVAI